MENDKYNELINSHNDLDYKLLSNKIIDIDSNAIEVIKKIRDENISFEEVKESHPNIVEILNEIFDDYIKHDEYKFYNNMLIRLLIRLIIKTLRILTPIVTNFEQVHLLTREIVYSLNINDKTPHYDAYLHLFNNVYVKEYRPLSTPGNLDEKWMLKVMKSIVLHARAELNLITNEILVKQGDLLNYDEFLNNFQTLNKKDKDDILFELNIDNIYNLTEIEYNRLIAFYANLVKLSFNNKIEIKNNEKEKFFI